MSLIAKIIFGLIALHLFVGFGWLVYKLTPRKREDKSPPES
jgi:hypothetical protein